MCPCWCLFTASTTTFITILHAPSFKGVNLSIFFGFTFAKSLWNSCKSKFSRFEFISVFSMSYFTRFSPEVAAKKNRWKDTWWGVKIFKTSHLRISYRWWTKSCTTKDDDYPIIDRVLTIPGGSNILSINSIMGKHLRAFRGIPRKEEIGAEKNITALKPKGMIWTHRAWIPK